MSYSQFRAVLKLLCRLFSTQVFQVLLKIDFFFAVKEGQISKDGQWMWVNSEWKLIADLDRNDYKKDSNAGYWYGKNDQNIFI